MPTNGDEIDELLQETLLKALISRDYFRNDENLHEWFSVGALHTASSLESQFAFQGRFA